jgi:hypothetical protein
MKSSKRQRRRNGSERRTGELVRMNSLPEPPPIHDAVFDQLKSHVLDALAQADRGELVSEEDAFAMFGIAPP